MARSASRSRALNASSCFCTTDSGFNSVCMSGDPTSAYGGGGLAIGHLEALAILRRWNAESPFKRPAKRVGAAETNRTRNRFDRRFGRGQPLARRIETKRFDKLAGRAPEDQRELPAEMPGAQIHPRRERRDGEITAKMSRYPRRQI